MKKKILKVFLFQLLWRYGGYFYPNSPQYTKLPFKLVNEYQSFLVCLKDLEICHDKAP